MSAPLRQRLAAAPGPADPDYPVLIAPAGRLTRGTAAALAPAPAVPAGARVAVCLADRMALVRTLIALDGHAGALLLLTADLEADTLGRLAQIAGCDLIITDRDDISGALAPDAAVSEAGPPAARAASEWMMTTSGTTGTPKVVPHTLDSLARTVRSAPLDRAPVWGLVLEPTRFAGLQVVLQALLGGGTLATAPQEASLADQIAWLAEAGVTHLSATPTLWRRLLMAPGTADMLLRQVTMGGEIADQAVLDAARTRFPAARLTHIYASTEVGVGFGVNDGRAGFPLTFMETAPGGVGIRVVEDQLRLRPPDGRVPRYLGDRALDIDAEGYVATGDRVEIAGDRVHFLGRDSGAVNVGGVKVWPERVERTIAEVPGVGQASVAAKKSPITGALLMATVVPAARDLDREALRQAVLEHCRATLEREAVPARIHFADSLPTNAAGKIIRA